MKKAVFTGAAVALVTPFHKDGSVNYGKLEELIDYQIENSTDAIVVCATTGESPTLSYEEHEQIVRCCVEYAAGRVPIIAGTGSNDTKKCFEAVKRRGKSRRRRAVNGDSVLQQDVAGGADKAL